MVRILLIAFISAFSLVFGGCSVCQIKNTVFIEQLNELCADVKWLFKSYEERIEYSLRPFLDIIKEDFKEYQDLREKTFRLIDELKLPRKKPIKEGKEPIKEEDIENFLKNFFDHDKIKEEAYIFAKEPVKETLKDLNSYYLGEKNDFHMGRKECHIVFPIYIAKDTIEKKNEKSREFISELSKLYESEHGNVGGFVKLQQRKEEENYNNSVYNIDELYGIFENFYKKSNVGVNEGSIAENLADAVVEFYKGKKEVDKDKQKKMFEKEIEQIDKDIPRTFPYFKEYFKEEKDDEFRRIFSKMVLLFAVFCIRVINEKEKFPSLSANDVIKELSGMQGLGEKQIQYLYQIIMKNRPTLAYPQGMNFFAGFFVTLYFIVNQKFGGNVNKEEIINESKIIKLFVFYLLHKWDCDSSVNYLSSYSLYSTSVSSMLLFFILLRRCKLLHVYTDYEFNEKVLSSLFVYPFFSYSLSQTNETDYCLDYIMYLDLHLYIVKNKDINFYFDWLNFLYYKILHIIEKKDLKYYGDGPYTEIVKVLFSPGTKNGQNIENVFFSEEKYDYIFKNFRRKKICTIF